MLLIAGLLTLVALSSAGGDHTKGGGHIKGGHHAASAHHAASKAVEAASDSDFGTQTFVEPKSTGVKGGGASVLIPVQVEDESGSAAVSKKNIISAPVSYRDPIALPVANQPAITTLKTVKTVKTVTSVSKPQSVDRPSIAIQEQIKNVAAVPSLKATSDIRPAPLVPSGQSIGSKIIARQVIVYDDGTIVDVGSASGNAGLMSNEDLKRLIEGNSGTGGSKEVIVYDDGTIEQVGGGSRASGQVTVKPGSAGNAATVGTVQKPATSPARKPDLKLQERPISPAFVAPKPKPARITPQQSSNDELVKINKELIQRQNQQGFIQTFGQKVKPDSDLGDISIALSELGDTRPVKPVDISRPKAPIPKAQKPKSEKPKVIPSTTSTSKITTYGSSRTETSRISSQQPTVGGGTQGFSSQFGLSAAQGSYNSNENIKLINRQLIQRQEQGGVLQAFGGIVKSESDLTGLPVSLDQISGFGQPRPISPKVEYRQPVTLPKPKVSTTTSRGQTVKYTGNGVSSGISGSLFSRTSPVRPEGGGTQEYSSKLGSGTTQGSYGSNENIKLINRQLIQRQDQEGVLNAFGGIVKSESDLTGLPVSLDQIGDFGQRKPIAPKVEYKQPVALPKPKVSTTTSRGQAVKYSGTGVSSAISGSSFSRTIPARPVGGTQEYSNQFVSGTAQRSYGSNENIKLINRGLIQRQDQEGVLNAFGGIVKSESDLTGLPVSLDQFVGYGARQPLTPKVEYKQPVALPKLKDSTTTSRGQAVQYIGTGVSSGISGSSFSRTSPGRTIIGGTQGYSNQFGLGTAQGSYGSNENIKLINRQLIQRQEQEGVLQAFGGIVKSEYDLTGLPVSLDQIGGFGQRKPIAPKVEYKQPVALPKPKVSTTTTRDQTLKYTGTGVSSGISGSSFSRTSPVRLVGGGTQVYSNQFGLGTAQGSYGSNENIKLINRELIQRQDQEGVLNAFGGIVKSESDLTGLPVSLDQFVGYGARQPLTPIQYKQPASVSKPRTPTRVVSSNTGKDQIVRYTGSRVTSGILGPSAPRVTPVRGNVGTTQTQRQYAVRNNVGSVSSNDNLKLINRQLIQRQNEEGILNTFGGVAKTESELAGISVSMTQLDDLSKPKNVPQIRKPVAVRDDKLKFTGTQVTSGQTGSFGTRNTPLQAVFGNAAGSISTGGTQQVSAPKPKPFAPANISPQNQDIITLNRNLIQKQNQRGILQTFGGIAKHEADLEGKALSLEEFGDLKKFTSFDAGIQQAPKAPKRPVVVAPKRPSSVGSSQATGGVNQPAPGVRIQTTEAQRFAPARISPQNTIPTSDNQRTATRTSSGINTLVSGGVTAGISSSSQSGLSEELINLNRQLIEKQNREGIRQTFGGVVKNEEDLEGGVVYVDELDAITKLVGYNAPKDQGPQTYGYSVSSGQSSANRNVASRSQAQGGRFTPVEHSRIVTGILPSGFLDLADRNKGGQFQVKVEGVDDLGSLSQVQDSSDIPSISSLATQTFKQEDIQENVQLSNYSPLLKPLNYRTQPRTSASDSQNILEQQKIEQVHV